MASVQDLGESCIHMNLGADESKSSSFDLPVMNQWPPVAILMSISREVWKSSACNFTKEFKTVC